jgi:hypothetical protein
MRAVKSTLVNFVKLIWLKFALWSTQMNATRKTKRSKTSYSWGEAHRVNEELSWTDDFVKSALAFQHAFSRFERKMRSLRNALPEASMTRSLKMDVQYDLEQFASEIERLHYFLEGNNLADWSRSLAKEIEDESRSIKRFLSSIEVFDLNQD